jgi:hypothetical protein
MTCGNSGAASLLAVVTPHNWVNGTCADCEDLNEQEIIIPLNAEGFSSSGTPNYWCEWQEYYNLSGMCGDLYARVYVIVRYFPNTDESWIYIRFIIDAAFYNFSLGGLSGGLYGMIDPEDEWNVPWADGSVATCVASGATTDLSFIPA